MVIRKGWRSTNTGAVLVKGFMLQVGKSEIDQTSMISNAKMRLSMCHEKKSMPHLEP